MPEARDGSPADDARPTPWERNPPPEVGRRTDGHRDEPDARHQEWSRHQRLALLAGKVAVAVVAVLVFLATSAGWAATQWLDGRFRQVSALDPNSEAVTDAPAQYGDENFLLVGSDTRAGAQAGDDVGTAEQIGGARADTIMVAHLPADRSRAVVVSFPRDLQVTRPACEVWDPVSGAYTGETDPGESISKINSAYQIGGPRCLTRVVQQLSGLVVNHFLGVDFQGFKAMVDAVGGVEVCVEQPLEDLELGLIIPRPGVSTISGTTALDFVRARSVVGDPTGDYGRILRQQRFLSSLLRELLSADVLFSGGTLRAVTDAVAANTFGENVEVGTLLRLAQSLQGVDPAEVTFVTVPTVGEANGYGNEELREQDTRLLFQAIITGRPLPGAVPATSHPPGPRPSTAGPNPAPPPPPPGAPPPLPGDLATVNAADTACG